VSDLGCNAFIKVTASKTSWNWIMRLFVKIVPHGLRVESLPVNPGCCAAHPARNERRPCRP